MRTRTLKNAKLVVKIKSGIANLENPLLKISTISVFDNRKNSFWSKEKIEERGIEWFLNLDDLKETLNWNTNGDSSKYQFAWGMTVNGVSEGIAYVFD